MIRIENWSILSEDKDDKKYAPPEQYLFCITGIVYGHPKFQDGEPVKTGRISRYNNGRFITVNKTEYVLGSVNPEYESEYPRAYGRLVNMAEKYLREG